MRYLIAMFFMLSFAWAEGQSDSILMGRVMTMENGEHVGLSFANVYWQGTTIGTSANEEGKFRMVRHPEITKLVISYVGYVNDTVETAGKNHIHIMLEASKALEEVTISEEKNATSISSLNNIKTEILSEKEFKKAACCNLSESFETNPTVEVSYSDALTGIKQIRMLGLSGIYAQTLVENMPFVHGLSAATGLTYIPGPFVESVHLSKGAGSVVYGFESMSGQINIDLKKPESMNKWHLNAYANAFGRAEANVLTKRRFGARWYSSLLAHGNLTKNAFDPNGDGFLNMPSGNSVNLMNRWKYVGDNWEAQLGVKFLNDVRIGGQTGYKRGMESDSTTPYGVEYITRQYGAWAKLGRPATEEKQTSIGFIVHANRYENGFKAGLNQYNGEHNNFFGTFIFNRNLKDENHVLTGGLSVLADDYTERFNRWNFRRTEVVPGAFAEYTYNMAKVLSVVTGIRADYHNLFGFFATPRVHVRYTPKANHTFRASAGRGQRTANVFTENSSILISSRRLVLADTNSGTYGLNPEVSWNYGANYTFDFKISSRRTGQLSLDYYYVYFQNQAVVDMDANARQIMVSNLNGSSYSQTFQAQLTLEPLRKLELRFAYRYLDVRTTFAPGLMQKALIPPHRGFINIGYETAKKWSFDVTTQFIGKKRLPILAENPENLRFGAYSPSYMNVNLQVSKTWKKLEAYAGVENLLNITQKDLIIDPSNPYGQYFDAGMVWGPSMGTLVYFGLRYDIKN
ncbi:MAG: TonB-dependent receptor [Bacteroidetes bacterium]|nr:MAG: TonB-dependent receptor [Bacteroidota bacterium]